MELRIQPQNVFAMISHIIVVQAQCYVFFDNDKGLRRFTKSNVSELVYRILTTVHPSSQARNYLLKGDKAQKKIPC